MLVIIHMCTKMKEQASEVFLTLYTLALTLTGCVSWPDGLYGLPMPMIGCPVTQSFNWSIGARTQQTESGSVGSEPNHLAGVYSYETSQITQNFCMKMNPVGDGEHVWQQGRYCIFKASGHSCPVGFTEGYIYWDDAAPHMGHSIQSTSGTLPEGRYDRNTEIYFCCRKDGQAFKEIELPTESPFYLLKWGDRCQEVEDMDVSEEWVKWRDEKFVNWNSYGGLYPKIQHSKYPVVFTKLYYCYYQKEPENKTMQTILLVVYVIAGIVGLVIFLLVLTCLLQRIFSRHPKDYDYEENNAANTSRERSLRSDPMTHTEPIVSYQRVPQSDRYGLGGDAGVVNIKQGPQDGAPNYSNPRDVQGMNTNTQASGESGAVGGTPGAMLSPDYYEPGPPSYEEVLRADGKL